jgi:hypothetical protein
MVQIPNTGMIFPVRLSREVQLSNANAGKHPPQFVFDMIVAQTARAFLDGYSAADDLAKVEADKFSAIYDIEGLPVDILAGVERFLVFIGSVEISDVDLILSSFVWYSANFENLTTARKKKSLFGNPLKGRPKDPARVFIAASAFKTYTYGVGSRRAPVRPVDWTPKDEVEFEPIFSLLYPPPPEDPALTSI